jgi:predicted lipoprotein with Yx(FWY)xxD motif
VAKRASTVLAVLTALALAIGAAASTATVPVDSAKNVNLGPILVDAHGHTLYHDGSEARDSVKCTGTCTTEWLPLLVGAGARLHAGQGVTAALLGTIKRPDGKIQVTYHGFALYLFVGDTKPGQANGQDSMGHWHAVAPSGKIVSGMGTGSAVSTSTGSPSSGSKGSGSSSGSGSGNVVTGSGYGSSSSDPCVANPNGPNCGM